MRQNTTDLKRLIQSLEYINDNLKQRISNEDLADIYDDLDSYNEDSAALNDFASIFLEEEIGQEQLVSLISNTYSTVFRMELFFSDLNEVVLQLMRSARDVEKVCIVIPIQKFRNKVKQVIDVYHKHYTDLCKKNIRDFEIVLVTYNCNETTLKKVKLFSKKYNKIHCLDGIRDTKNRALLAAFRNALLRDADFISYLDPYITISPNDFDEAVYASDKNECGGIIISRYLSYSKVIPEVSWWKRYKNIFSYETLVYLLFGMHFYDFQSGTKIFSRKVIEDFTNFISPDPIMFDIELLYLCKENNLCVHELGATWYGKNTEDLGWFAKIKIIGSIIKFRLEKSRFNFWDDL